MWRAEVDKVNKKVGQSLADPEKYDNLFPGFHDSIKTQQYLLKEKNLLPAHQAVQVPLNITRNAVEEMKLAEARGEFDYETNSSKSKEGGEPSLLGEDNNGINPFMNATTSHLVSHVKEVCLLFSLSKPSIANFPFLQQIIGNGNPTELLHPELPKRKSSLDEYEFEIDQDLKELSIGDQENTKVSFS